NLLNKNAPVVTCIVDGAIILDCAHGSLFEVDLSEDVNSITIKNCDAPGQEMGVNFRGTTVDPLTGFRFISGWPDDIVCSVCGTAIEPTSVPFGNTFNQSFVTNRHGTPASTGKRPGGGTNADCLALCVKDNSWGSTPFASKFDDCLEICEEQPGGGIKGSGPGGLGGIPSGDGQDGLDPCDDTSDMNVQVEVELDCEEATPLVKLRVCGGTPPYTWVVEGGEGTPTTELGGAWDQVNTVKPQAGTPGLGGEAYQKIVAQITGAGCSVIPVANVPYDCDGVATGGCSFISTSPPECPGVTGPVVCRDISCTDPLDVCGGVGEPCGAGASTVLGGGGSMCDRRNQSQKDAGCLPCRLSMDGVTITVTDAEGVSVVTVISG
ncbi:hypothetical protein LCGC14_2758640, partial [marine sediment metagenome]